MKTYSGRPPGEVLVSDGSKVRRLPLRLDVRNHSPTGFAWSYGGSGPAQLALAILCDHLGDDEEAERFYHEFKSDVIAGLPAGDWTLTSADIDRALEEIRAEWPPP